MLKWVALRTVWFLLMAGGPVFAGLSLAQKAADVDVEVTVEVEKVSESSAAEACKESSLWVSSIGQRLFLEMRADAKDVLGFDHLPQTVEEIAAVNELISLLNTPPNMFQMDPFAKCEVSEISVGGQLMAHAKITSKQEGEVAPMPDVRVEYRYVCSSMANLKKLRAEYFKHLPRLSCTAVFLKGAERKTPILDREHQVIELK